MNAYHKITARHPCDPRKVANGNSPLRTANALRCQSSGTGARKPDTLALGGKFKPRGHKTLSDYVLRVEVTGDNVRADAALIEAAPELYRALADLVSIAADEGVVGDNTTIPAALSALAKARGEVA